MRRILTFAAAAALAAVLCACGAAPVDYTDSGTVITLELSPGLGDPESSYTTRYVLTAEGMAYLRGTLYRESGSLTLPQIDKQLGADAVREIERRIDESGFTSLPAELELDGDEEKFAVITLRSRTGDIVVRGREDCNKVFSEAQSAIESAFGEAETTGFHTVAKAFVKGQ